MNVITYINVQKLEIKAFCTNMLRLMHRDFSSTTLVKPNLDHSSSNKECCLNQC